MSKRSYPLIFRGAARFVVAATYLLVPVLTLAQATETGTSSNRFGALVNSQVERARGEVERTERLVEDGTLPRVRLYEAKLKLADAEDEAVLTRTLYGFKSAGSMTKEEGEEMLESAQRRVDRARTILDGRKRLLDSGAIARVEMETAEHDLADREQSLKFAQDRIRLLHELASMAETERELAKSSEANRLQASMRRYNGNGVFTLDDLTPIETQFERKFHHPLPISAMGQTLTHRALGLDHRNRVDVALSPAQPEGIWLLTLLERLHVPYLAFRSAVAGAATAPHIHIGVGSTRLPSDLQGGTHAVYSRPFR